MPMALADCMAMEKDLLSIKNQKAPIVGNVCMDMIMVNITDIDCNEGDEVIIFGKETYS